MYQKVTNDLFCIAKQLKYIDKVYHVFRNERDNRFEVHSSGNPSIWTLSFIVPFDRLDQRTLDYARQTRKQNADILDEQVRLQNAQIEKDNLAKLQKLEYTLADMLDYANKTGRDVAFK